MDFNYLIKVLLKRIWILILIPIVVGVASYFFTGNLPKEYKSVSQLSTGITTYETIDMIGEDPHLRDLNVRFVNIIETMQSPVVLSLLSYKLLLHELTSNEPFIRLDEESLRLRESVRKGYNGDLTSDVENKLKNFELVNLYDPKDQQIKQMLELYDFDYSELTKEIRVFRLGGSDYIQVEAVTNSPYLSAYMVNSLIEEFLRYYRHSSQTKNSRSLDYFERLAQQKKEALEEKQTILNNYRESNNVINFSAESESSIAKINEYEVKRDDLLQQIEAVKISLQRVDQQINNFSDSGSSYSNEINKRIVDLRRKISQLSQIEASDNSDVQEALANLRSQLEKAIAESNSRGAGTGSSLQDLEAKKHDLELELEINQANLASVTNILRTIKGSVSGMASKEATIEKLSKEVEIAREEYVQAISHFNTEKNKTLLDDSSLKVLISGQPNTKPESSQRKIIVALSVITSELFTVGIIVLLVLVDFRIRTPEQLASKTKLSVSGYLNEISKNLDFGMLFSKVSSQKEQETFKQLLRKLRFELISGLDEARVFMVTSTKSGEGKSFLILSLAYSLSLIDRRILIIDTNFKNNSLTKLLVARTEFKDLITEGQYYGRLLPSPDLNKQQDSSELKSTFINKTSNANIDIIGSRFASESPSEIFKGKSFKSMLKELSQDYDYIFLEGPSINEFSDTKELAGYVDKVIPVFSANSVLTREDMDSISFLKKLNGRLTGAVLNQVQLQNVKSII